ncbi:hypothetical protein DSECCO2_621520 [anaerobic digester metagenome]
MTLVLLGFTFFSARNRRTPFTFRVPPTTPSPSRLSAGMGSPVIIDSSTELSPPTTVPSTGTFSPGRTRRMSPTTTSSMGTSTSRSLRITVAVLGRRPIRLLMASDVLPFARASR